jgi:hypothetical protein
VLAQWTDGSWYPGKVVAFQNGQYQIDWDGNPHAAWVPSDCVRPKP